MKKQKYQRLPDFYEQLRPLIKIYLDKVFETPSFNASQRMALVDRFTSLEELQLTPFDTLKERLTYYGKLPPLYGMDSIKTLMKEAIKATITKKQKVELYTLCISTATDSIESIDNPAMRYEATSSLRRSIASGKLESKDDSWPAPEGDLLNRETAVVLKKLFLSEAEYLSSTFHGADALSKFIRIYPVLDVFKKAREEKILSLQGSAIPFFQKMCAASSQLLNDPTLPLTSKVKKLQDVASIYKNYHAGIENKQQAFSIWNTIWELQLTCIKQLPEQEEMNKRFQDVLVFMREVGNRFEKSKQVVDAMNAITKIRGESMKVEISQRLDAAVDWVGTWEELYYETLALVTLEAADGSTLVHLFSKDLWSIKSKDWEGKKQYIQQQIERLNAVTKFIDPDLYLSIHEHYEEAIALLQ